MEEERASHTLHTGFPSKAENWGDGEGKPGLEDHCMNEQRLRSYSSSDAARNSHPLPELMIAKVTVGELSCQDS